MAREFSVTHKNKQNDLNGAEALKNKKQAKHMSHAEGMAAAEHRIYIAM